MFIFFIQIMNTEHNCDFEDGSSILAATSDLGLSPNKMQDGVEPSDGEESSDQTELSDETSVQVSDKT